MKKINKSTQMAILKKTPWAHSVRPREEGLNEDDIKGLFYRAITDKEDSVIAEINRIVDECNRQLSDIDITEYIGKFETQPYALSQKWLRVNRLIFAYELSTEYTSKDVSSLNSVINMREGYNLLLRLYAPDGVVPDENLLLSIASSTFFGLEVLSNSDSDAFDGNYHIDFAVPRAGSVTELSIKWNKDSEKEVFLVDFLYTRENNNELFIRFADDGEGTNMSDTQSESHKYLGIYYGSGDSNDFANYKWIKFRETTVTWYECNTTIGDFRGKTTLEVSVPYVKPNSYVIASPNVDCIDEYIRCGIYCSLTEDGKILITCSEEPQDVIKIIFLIGNKI